MVWGVFGVLYVGVLVGVMVGAATTIWVGVTVAACIGALLAYAWLTMT